MAFRGTLRDVALGEVLQLIGFQRRTGVLTVEGIADRVTISFLRGEVVGADSARNRLADRVGQLLVRAGLLDPAVLPALLEEQKKTGEKLGTILLTRGQVPEEDVRRALRTQILNIIYRLFRWKDGRYDFSQETAVAGAEEHLAPLDTQNILMEAARMADEWPLIEKRIPSLNMIFARARGVEQIKLVAASPAASSPVEGTLFVSPPEAQVWPLVNGERPVSEICESVFLSDFEAVKALDELLSRHLVVEAVAPETEIQRPAAAQEPLPPAPLPWAGEAALWVVLVVLLVFSLLRTPEHGASKAVLPVRRAIAVSRLLSVDHAIELYYLLQGKYPTALSQLPVSEVFSGVPAAENEGLANYRYILRPADGKYGLYGMTPSGTIDPSLSITRTLDPVMETKPFSGLAKGKNGREPNMIEVVK